MSMTGDINFFGLTNFRNEKKKFGIKTDDRRRHFYAIGKTGMGKSEMLKNMAIQDIQAGHGLGFIDPHGESADALLDFVPEERVKDVIYINPSDTEFPIAFNVMEKVDATFRHLIASGLMSVFEKIWPDVWSERMKYILNNTVLALLEYPDSTLLGINRMLVDVDYRQKVLEVVTDPVIKAFWTQEYARYTQRYEIEATAAIQNKIGQFVSNPLIRNIVGQVRSTINMRKIMDDQKILIVNLSKGKIGEDNSRLLGAMIITKLQLAAMSRVDIPERDRKDFFLYIDEFQNFATESFVGILSEARKYRLSLLLSHQYITQLDETVRDAVFGNVGTMVSFRIGAADAEILEQEFSPAFLIEDFINLAKYQIYVKLMIDGIAGRPFSAETMTPFPIPDRVFREEIIQSSRSQYGTPVAGVERNIMDWTGLSGAIAHLAALAAQPQEALYDAICDRCKKPTKVVFPPDGKRPVYCKSCRKKMKRDREERDESLSSQHIPSPVRAAQYARSDRAERPKEIPLQEALQKGPVLFHASNHHGNGSTRDLRPAPFVRHIQNDKSPALPDVSVSADPHRTRESAFSHGNQSARESQNGALKKVLESALKEASQLPSQPHRQPPQIHSTDDLESSQKSAQEQPREEKPVEQKRQEPAPEKKSQQGEIGPGETVYFKNDSAP